MRVPCIHMHSIRAARAQSVERHKFTVAFVRHIWATLNILHFRNFSVTLMSMHVIFRGYRIVTNGFKAQCSPQKSSVSRRWSAPTVSIVRLQPRRPTLDDVQRLSEGKSAKSRGFGSRQIPHRLNVEERAAYNIAQQKGFLTLKGSGYRRERKGSPLANIYRQLSDAMNRPCVIVMQQNGQNGQDIVLVDFSPLRLLDFTEVRS